MIYKGRIIGLVIALVVTFIKYYLDFYKSGIYYDTSAITFTVLLSIFAWWIGMQFDKVSLTNKELQQSKVEMQSLFDNSDSFIWSSDLINQRNKISKGMENTFGYSTQEFEEDYQLWISRTYPEDIEKVNQLYNELLAGQSSYCEWRIIRRDGEIRWIEAHGNPVFNSSGAIVKLIGVAHDITERKENEEKIRYHAYYDSLTELPNRYMVNNYLEKFLALCKRDKTKLAILFLDLDRFKSINDTMGHKVGDTLLRQASKRFVNSVRLGDIVSRYGGDEFIIILKDINELEVREIAERILESFEDPFILNNEEFFTSPSIGISLYPQDGTDNETLIGNADTAMYEAKRRGKNNYQFFVHEPEEVVIKRNKLEQGLKRGLTNKEFTLHYQPQLELSSGQLRGVEALIRWNHPEYGLIQPSEFIPIAEKTGLILPIGNWVIETACKQNRTWQKQGLPEVVVAVNVSALQFKDNNFVKIIERILDESQLAPELLELEMTESVMQCIQESSAIFRELKDMGVKIAIDDFGTGYSSLNLLNNLPIDYVKIDRSFTNEIVTNSNTASLVKTIIQMVSNLKFEMIAEGIENEQQAEFLSENGCRFGQGYLYSPPLPADEIEKLIKRHQ